MRFKEDPIEDRNDKASIPRNKKFEEYVLSDDILRAGPWVRAQAGFPDRTNLGTGLRH
jgi:hypothetical protein